MLAEVALEMIRVCKAKGTRIAHKHCTLVITWVAVNFDKSYIYIGTE